MRSFFLMALIVLCAMPILASTPEQDMVLIVDEDDGEFSGLEQVSDEEMAQVEGDRVVFEDVVPKSVSVSNLEWHDITVVYGSNGYAIIDWNGQVISDSNHDGSITAEDLVLILNQQGFDPVLSLYEAGAVFCLLESQKIIFNSYFD